ncbi:MAG: NADH-quinone oxidoreductase subunit F [Firmicutes bacterium HGW-Firmicutes-17]|nr:MAG: NADH-quinone oxidoreductase subunit F [Firmicutes bacterium HGW-Firmicutes-17]
MNQSELFRLFFKKENVMKTIRICVGSSCHVNGSYKVVKALNQLIDQRELKNEVELVGSFCMGKCTEGVAVECDDIIYAVSVENVEEIFEKILGGK